MWFELTTHFIDQERTKGWVGLVGWRVADGLPTLVVSHQLQVERRTGKVRQSETDVLPLCHSTNLSKYNINIITRITSPSRKLLFFACFRFLIFHPFSRDQLTPFAPMCGGRPWLWFLRPTRHKIGHFGDVFKGQSLGLVRKKINLTQQKQAFTDRVYSQRKR